MHRKVQAEDYRVATWLNAAQNVRKLTGTESSVCVVPAAYRIRNSQEIQRASLFRGMKTLTCSWNWKRDFSLSLPPQPRYFTPHVRPDDRYLHPPISGSRVESHASDTRFIARARSRNASGVANGLLRHRPYNIRDPTRVARPVCVFRVCLRRHGVAHACYGAAAARNNDDRRRTITTTTDAEQSIAACRWRRRRPKTLLCSLSLSLSLGQLAG